MTRRLLPFILLILCCTPVGAETLTVTFQDSVTVGATEVVLADIARITPSGKAADILGKHSVARAPSPGETRVLRAATIIASLRHTVDREALWQGAESITVSRAALRISKDELEAIIAQFLIDNIKQLPRADIRMTAVKAPDEIVLPAGDISWEVIPSRPEILGSSSFSIHFLQDGQPVKTCSVRGKLEVLAEVATLAAPLPRGERILARHITMSQRDISTLQDPFFTPQQVVGLQAKRSLRKGNVIERRHVEPPPAVLKGEMVKILADNGQMRISTAGIAKTDGRTGQMIRVENINSNKLVYCRVEGPGMVSVEF